MDEMAQGSVYIAQYEHWMRPENTKGMAFRRGDTLTHLRRIRAIREDVVSGEAGGVIQDGATTYLGSPKSGAMIRVYDKAAESGRIGAGVRWELQVRGQLAVRFVTGAIEAKQDLGRYVVGCMCGLIDFRDRSGQERGDRAPRLDWWAAVVADGARVRLSGPARVSSLEKRAAWLRNQVAPTLALLWMTYGDEWLNAVLQTGEARLTDADRRLLAKRLQPEMPAGPVVAP